jgi:xanthine dehydrogenase large subunit
MTQASPPHGAHHESAAAQINGSARYIDDLPEMQGTLHAAPILSPIAHGQVLGLHTEQAFACAGVHAIIGSGDIVGDPLFASFSHDESIFADKQVQHVGHVMGLVVADSHKHARVAARAVKADIKAQPAVLDVRQAYAQQHWVLPPVCVQRGNAEQAMATAPHVLTGSLDVGGQEHFYLEGQIAYAIPQDGGQWLIHSSTQHPGEVQHWVAHALNIPLHAVRVVCRRMGGGFGGKETQAGHLAVWAAVAAHQLQRPVKMRLDRDDDFVITGKRHPFSYDYTVGFDDTGRILGLHVVQLADCGHSADLSGPVSDRAVFHTDNAYFLEHVRIDSYRCKTHKQSHTAFRGFGGPQGMIVTETLLGDIARHLGLDPLGQPTGTRLPVQPTPCRDSSVEYHPNHLEAGHRADPCEIWHQLHRHAVQPSGCAGACLQRWQCAGEPRRHRDGPRPAHQSGAYRGAHAGHLYRARVGGRQ